MAKATVTLTGALRGGDGQPLAGGVPVLIGLQCTVVPHDPTTDAADALALAAGAAPVALAFDGGAAPAGLAPTVWRRTGTAADGTFSLSTPTPSALAYAHGARTDADLDPARGGRWRVQAWALVGCGAPIAFPLDESAIADDGTLDVTTALAAEPF